MTYQTIQYDLADDIATITLNRPEVMNALSSKMRVELMDALAQAKVSARVIVLAGTGRAFCSGQDLADAADVSQIDLQATLRDEYEPLLLAIMACPVPVLAAVNGTAAGAGANLALACDVVIACESASFIQAFTRIGLMPDAGGTYWLPRQVGHARAMGAMLFADKISARQAMDWGMIWECVADADFAAHVRARALHLAQGPTKAYGAVKQALSQSPDNDLKAQLALEARLQGECGKTQDFQEGVSAFLLKRPAKFVGH